MIDLHFKTHPIEILWLLCSLGAFAMTNITFYNAVRDLAFLDAKSIHAEARLIAICNLRREAAYVMMAAVSMIAAVMALWLEPPPPNYIVIPQIIIGMLGWIAVSLLMAFSSNLDRRLHQQLDQEAQPPKPGEPGFVERRSKVP